VVAYQRHPARIKERSQSTQRMHRIIELNLSKEIE
jgi:hypothetical protein